MTDLKALRALACMMLLGVFCMLPTGPAMAASAAATAQGSQSGKGEISTEAVMQQFSGDEQEAPERRISDKRKHQILFLMGISLLVLLLVTGSLGISMVAFGKDVFVAHMIFAGLSMTLAVVHAATSIAWFWPY